MSFDFDLNHIDIGLPNGLSIDQPYVCLIYWWLFILVLAMVLKIFLKAPHLKAGVICAVSILVMTVVCGLIYAYEIPMLDELLKPLPFLNVQEDTVQLVVYRYDENGNFDTVTFFTEVVSLFVLAFLVNQVYDYQQGNLKTPGWLAFRLISTLICIGVHFGFCYFMEMFLAKIPEDSNLRDALTYFPFFFLGGLTVTFTLALLKNMIKHLFKMVHPTFEGLHGFYFGKKFGTMLTRAIYTTLFLTLFSLTLQSKCEEFSIAPAIVLGDFTPGTTVTLIALAVLWVFVGFLL